MQSISPSSIFARSLKRGGILVKGLNTVFIDAFSILMNEEDNNTKGEKNTRDKKGVSNRRVDIFFMNSNRKILSLLDAHRLILLVFFLGYTRDSCYCIDG